MARAHRPDSGSYDYPCPRCGRLMVRGHTLEESRVCRKAAYVNRYKRLPDALVHVKLDTGRTLFAQHREALKQQGCQLGGRVQAARRSGWRFDSPEGLAAAAAGRERARRQKYGPYGQKLRTFARAARRPKVAYAPLRERYTHEHSRGLYYDPERKQWMCEAQTLNGVDYPTRPINERTALRRLGHLPRLNRKTIGAIVEIGDAVRPHRGKRKKR